MHCALSRGFLDGKSAFLERAASGIVFRQSEHSSPDHMHATVGNEELTDLQSQQLAVVVAHSSHFAPIESRDLESGISHNN
jgi:hypothetical protein